MAGVLVVGRPNAGTRCVNVSRETFRTGLPYASTGFEVDRSTENRGCVLRRDHGVLSDADPGSLRPIGVDRRGMHPEESGDRGD